jgi:hypothetical protein
MNLQRLQVFFNRFAEPFHLGRKTSNPFITMKRICPVLLASLLLSAPAVQAQFTFTTNNGAITITGYTGSGGTVTIPSTTNGLPVTSIGDQAFYNCTSLTALTIPDSVTSIGHAAFEFCTSLTSITFPSSVTNIGQAAFWGCSSLTVITVDPLNPAYSSLAGVLFNKNHTTLIACPGAKGGGYMIPNSVTCIGDAAFVYCRNLTSVTIPSSVASIQSSAFFGCDGLTGVTIPSSVTSIGDEVFSDCFGLTAITVDVFNPAYSSHAGVLFDKSQTTLIEYPGGNAGDYTIPSSVTSIHKMAFADCYLLSGITIPSSVTSIGDNAFMGCSGLNTVTVPSSVTSIGYGAFENCTSLTSITIPSSVTSIGHAAFWGCVGLTAITVDALNPAYSSLAGVLFNKNQTALNAYPGAKGGTYTIPNSVTSVEDSAFAYCRSLTSVTIPCSVTNIGAYSFYYCTSLTNVYFQGNAPYDRGSSVFKGDNNAIVYYLPGTSGWGSTFGGAPAILWNPPNPAGSLQVTIAPTGAITAGAQWQVDGGIPQPSAATVFGLSEGSHTVSFASITGWDTPPNKTVTITNGATTTASGLYTPSGWMTDGLVAYYPFNGNANDQSGHGNDGIVYGATLTADRFGNPNNAYFFNGTSSYIRIPQSASLNNLQNATISYWTKYYKSTSGGYDVSMTICNGQDRFSPPGFWTYATATQLIHFLGQWNNVSVDVALPFDASVPLDQQAFVSVTFVANPTNILIYKNGALQGTTPRQGIGISRPSYDWFIGCSGDLGLYPYYLDGMMDDVRIYNRALSDQEVGQLYILESGNSNTAPIIITQPSSRTNLVGTTAYFTIQAAGAEPPSFQWRKDGTNLFEGERISGVTSNSLTITGVQGLDAGDYTVAVTNTHGSVTSSVAVLTVTGIPQGTTTHFFSGNITWVDDPQHELDGSIVANASNQVFTPFTGSYSFEISSAPVHTQPGIGIYRFNGMELSVGNYHPSLTPAFLEIDIPPYGSGDLMITAGMPGQVDYVQISLLGSGVFQSTSLAAIEVPPSLNVFNATEFYYSPTPNSMVMGVLTSLSSNAAPLVVSQPVSRTNQIGTTTSFSVSAVGMEPLNYQWRKDGINLTDGSSVSGVTTTNLTIFNIQPGDTGNYTVVVTNAYGSITSSVAVLTISGQASSQDVLLSADYYFSQTPPPLSGNHLTIQFQVPPLPSPTFQQESTNAFIFTLPAQINIGATSFVATVSAGWFAYDGGYQGIDVRFVPGFADNDFLQLIWHTPIPLFYGATDSPTLPQVQLQNLYGSAYYYTNNMGPVTGSLQNGIYSLGCSNNFAPVIVTQPADQSISRNANASFNMVAIGAAPMTYQWRKGGTNLLNGGAISGVNSTNLVVMNVQPDDAGGYSVVVTNAYGSITSSVAALTVVGGGGGITWFYDGFETYSPGAAAPPPWQGDGGGDFVSSAASYSGNNSLGLAGSAGGCWEGICDCELPATNAMLIEFSLYASSDHAPGCHPYTAFAGVRNTRSWTTATKGRTFITFDLATQNILLDDGRHSAGAWTYDQWTRIVLLYQRATTNILLTFWMDGSQFGPYSEPIDSEEDTMRYLEFGSGDGTTYLDDVAVRSWQSAPWAQLVVTPASLAADMVRGGQSLVTCTVSNVGSAPSGDLQMLLPNPPPNWLGLVTPPIIPSIPPQGYALVTLSLTPSNTLPLGPYTGSFVLASSTAGRITVPFQFNCVSDIAGSLRITVVDEFTYYAAGEPKVTNATVILSNPYDGSNLGSTLSDANGVAVFTNLLEGWYKISVQASNHGGFETFVQITGNQPVELTAFLACQLVSYRWIVTTNDITDRYEFTLETRFETDVPAPVVTVDPGALDLCNYTSATNYVNLTIANHGLVAAQAARLSFGSHPRFAITPSLTNLGDIPALGSVVVPVIIERLSGPDDGPSHIEAHLDWQLATTGGTRYYRVPIYVYDAGLHDCDPGVAGPGPIPPQPGEPNPGDPLPPIGGSDPGTPGDPPGTQPWDPIVWPPPPFVTLTNDVVHVGVGVRLEQVAVLTRSAFKASLGLSNGSSEAISNVCVTLDIRTAAGLPASNLFAIRGPDLTGLTDLCGANLLLPGGEGVAEWTIIPAIDAAPTGPTRYTVGGTLAYQQAGQLVQIPLFPVPITVFPEARLVVDYFWEQIVYSDDPFTPEIEPAIPFGVGLRMKNVGLGDARNVRITSAQPQITDNTNGLLVDFQLLASQVGAQAVTPSLTASLGDIASGEAATAVWWMTASLQGQFTNLSASFRHLDALGHVNLSLVDSVAIHPLVHVVRADVPQDDLIPDFLANDDNSGDGLPDHLYLSDGSVEPVTALTSAVLAIGQDNAQLTVAVPSPGWTYIRVPYPQTAPPPSFVRRSDGRFLTLGYNVWTTHRTVRTSGVREDYLHLLDRDSTGDYTVGYGLALASAVNPLPPTIYTTSFAVSWSSTNSAGGSDGLRYDVYVSVDGGQYGIWLANTPATTALFSGQFGHTYAFYSCTRDDAGNIELPPVSPPDAQTQLVQDTNAPTVRITSGPLEGERLTNAVVLLEGEASDEVGVAAVEWRLTNVNSPSVWQNAVGTNNWQAAIADLAYGTNTIAIRAWDTSGNVSLPAIRSFVRLAPLTVSLTGLGELVDPNDAGVTWREVGLSYTVTALPYSGYFFTNWTGSLVSTAATLTFVMQPGMMLQGNFVPVDTSPAPWLAITSHTDGQPVVGTNTLLTGIAYDAGHGGHGIASVLVNGSRANSDTAPGTNTVFWNKTVPLAAGTNKITVVARDYDGYTRTNLIRLVRDLTRPTIAITSPRANQRLTTPVFTATGKASDKVHVAGVWFRLNTNDWTQASGTTNWSAALALTPGTNTLSVWAVDTSGNCSLTNKVTFYYVVLAPLGLQISGRGTLSPSFTNGQLLEIGRGYSIRAAAKEGHFFDSWVVSSNWTSGVTSTLANLSFIMQSNLTIQANFKDVTRPTLAITSPTRNQVWGYASMPVKGTAKDNAQVASVHFRVNNGSWMDATGTTNWRGSADLVCGTNTVYAYAEDPTGNHSLTNAVKVIYNQFLPVSGTYYGLFSTSNRLHGSSGFFSLTVSDRGRYSGYLAVDGKPDSFTGAFDANGHTVTTVVRAATNLVTVTLALNLAPGSDQLTGTLSNALWVADLWADRAVWNSKTNKAPYAGTYTLIIPGGNDDDPTVPTGCGYGAVVIDTGGKVVLSGYLADGTALSQSTTVSKDGRWPLYAPLYAGTGSVYSWLFFTNYPPADLLGGQLSWSKPQQQAVIYYPLGFTNEVMVEGSRYVAPTNGTMRTLALTNGLVSFNGGNVSAPFTNLVILAANNVVTNTSTNRLILSLSTASGVFSGTVVVPGTKTTNTFRGAVLQNENAGYGFFLGTNQSGRLFFGPLP